MDTRLTQLNAVDIIAQYDIVVDCSDNFATRYLINDTCFHLNKSNVFASISQFRGQCTIFTPNNGPCYRCLYDSPSITMPNCAENGVLGILPGLLGSIQATEVIKLILGIRAVTLIGRLLTVDALTLQFREFVLSRNPNCHLCQQGSELSPANHHYDSIKPPVGVTFQELQDLQAKKADIFLLDVREPYEYEIHHLESILIPLGQLPERFSELDKNKSWIVYCKSGPRKSASG